MRIDFSQQTMAVQFAAHSIGLDHKRPYRRNGRWFYNIHRNYFDAAECDKPVWDELCEYGYAYWTGSVYKMTRDGLEWLGKVLKVTIL